MDSWWFETLPFEERQKAEPFHVSRFHRTLEEWVEMIAAAKLIVERLVEPGASRELAEKEPAVADTRVVPISLLVGLRKST